MSELFLYNIRLIKDVPNTLGPLLVGSPKRRVLQWYFLHSKSSYFLVGTGRLLHLVDATKCSGTQVLEDRVGAHVVHGGSVVVGVVDTTKNLVPDILLNMRNGIILKTRCIIKNDFRVTLIQTNINIISQLFVRGGL